MCTEMNDVSMIVTWAVRDTNKYGKESGIQTAKLNSAEFVISLISNRLTEVYQKGNCDCICSFVTVGDNRNA